MSLKQSDAILFSLAMSIAACSSGAVAQTTVTYSTEVSASEMVECFVSIERMREAGAESAESPCPPGVVGAHGVLAAPDNYPADFVQQVLDELTALASSTPSEFIRGEAAGWIGFSGRRDAGFQTPVPGVVTRLERVYEAAGSYATRRTVVELMGYQTDEVDAAAFLERIVRQAPVAVHAMPMPTVAAESLSRLGSIGEKTLQQLRQEGVLRTP